MEDWISLLITETIKNAPWAAPLLGINIWFGFMLRDCIKKNDERYDKLLDREMND